VIITATEDAHIDSLGKSKISLRLLVHEEPAEMARDLKRNKKKKKKPQPHDRTKTTHTRERQLFESQKGLKTAQTAQKEKKKKREHFF
jgi:hypothetical protein